MVAAAALTSIALYAAYASWVGLAGINLIDPVVVIGFLLGGAVPFAVAAMTITSVSKAARAVIGEMRRQFRESPGIMEGMVPPDSAACVDVATRHALREMIHPRRGGGGGAGAGGRHAGGGGAGRDAGRRHGDGRAAGGVHGQRGEGAGHGAAVHRHGRGRGTGIGVAPVRRRGRYHRATRSRTRRARR